VAPATIDEQLAAVLRDAAETHGVPGATAGVLVGDAAHTAAYGVANAEHTASVSPATLFQVGSITKPFVGAAALVLAGEGRLSLDDPLARHLPELGPATGLDTEAITVEMCLSHQAGFDGDHLFVERSDDLTRLAGARRLFPPGLGYSYSNAGFSLAGAVIEATSGEPFESFVRTRLLAPLGMRSACFRADEAITHPVAAPHWVVDGQAHVLRRAGWQQGWELDRADRPAGGLVASVEHLLTWCRFQMTGMADDGSPILDAAGRERFHAPVVEADAVDAIALDWVVRSIDGARSIGHGGVTVGYVSDLLVVPDRHFAVVGLTNATNGAAVNQAVRRWALEHLADLRERDPEPDPTLDVDLTRVIGSYTSPFAAIEVSAGADPGTIVIAESARTDTTGWQPPPERPITAAFFAHDHAVTLDAPGPARVVRIDADGDRAAWLLWGGRRSMRAR
jgi:CubicO group peptidase (beta-lactamase class C family)